MFFANLFLLKADWISDQVKVYEANENNIEDAFFVLQCDNAEDAKDLYKIESPEMVLYCSCLLQIQEKALPYYKDSNLQTERNWLRENNIKETLPWNELSNEFWEKLPIDAKKEALAQKYFYSMRGHFCEEDPQAPEQMKTDKPTFEKILFHVDNACNIDNINSTETFEQAYKSLSESMSSES